MIELKCPINNNVKFEDYQSFCERASLSMIDPAKYRNYLIEKVLEDSKFLNIPNKAFFEDENRSLYCFPDMNLLGAYSGYSFQQNQNGFTDSNSATHYISEISLDYTKRDIICKIVLLSTHSGSALQHLINMRVNRISQVNTQTNLKLIPRLVNGVIYALDLSIV